MESLILNIIKEKTKKFLFLETKTTFAKNIVSPKPTDVQKFNTVFLEEVDEFFSELDDKIKAKILFNIDKAEQTNDPRLFKKLTDDIWEMRSKYENLQYRLLAFWDKRNNKNILVVCTHGIVKKTDKMPPKEIAKAKAIRTNYFGNQ
jgi:phage-related protein